jgi:pimeloyl-ACP methyl ester carboxylesterase
MKRSYVDIHEGQIHYQMDGSGENLLLLHSTGMSSEEYFQMIPILARTHRVIAMDLLGYGNSDKPPLGFRIEDHALSIVHFLDALGFKKTSIAGHHGGSRLAVEIAATWPERVDKLVLSGCPWYSSEERQVLPNDPKFSPLEIKGDGSFMMELWHTFRSLCQTELKPEVMCKMMAAALMAGTGFHDLHQAAFHHDIEPRLRLIKSPTLLVAGTKDMFYSQLETISQVIPQSKTQVINGAGNFTCLEKPDEFAQAILDFLKGNV